MIDEFQTDLSIETFLALRNRFFDAGAVPKSYSLRDKLNTQDDPLDEYICKVLEADLRDGIEIAKASGPLITPDMAIFRSALCNRAPREELRVDSTRIFGLEVKKLERQGSGGISRASGMDYNTTPPCGTVRVYDRAGDILDIKGFYLFVCQEPVPAEQQTYRFTALAFCDGDLLNDDFDYYLSIVGQRTKEIGLGTYGDGANRVRPMIIFSNPLGASFLDHQSTLIHARADLQANYPTLRHIGTIERSVPGEADADPEIRTFHCYRDYRDAPESTGPFHVRDPFPTPKRTEKTISRGRFIIRIQPSR